MLDITQMPRAAIPFKFTIIPIHGIVEHDANILFSLKACTLSTHTARWINI